MHLKHSHFPVLPHLPLPLCKKIKIILKMKRKNKRKERRKRKEGRKERERERETTLLCTYFLKHSQILCVLPP